MANRLSIGAQDRKNFKVTLQLLKFKHLVCFEFGKTFKKKAAHYFSFTFSPLKLQEAC